MKKNLIIATMSTAMAACLAVGGTFAYLTAQAGTLTNTFAGAKSLSVTISETATDKETYDIDKDSTGELASGVNGGIAYTNVVPGAVLEKHPVVHVKQNGTKSYVFIKVTGLDGDAIADHDLAETVNTIGSVNYKWVAVESKEDVYVLTDTNGNYAVIDSSNGDVALDVFTQVTVRDNFTENVTIDNIVITAQTVQATGVSQSDALKAVKL